MWNPTKAGVYTMDGAVVIVHNNYVLPLNGQMTDLCDGMKWVKESTGIWAMLSPDWQDGAPTVDQLKRWQWWAVMHDDENLYCGKAKMSVAYFYIGNAVIDREFIGKSAPIQPDLTNGPLWVPLEVAK